MNWVASVISKNARETRRQIARMIEASCSQRGSSGKERSCMANSAFEV